MYILHILPATTWCFPFQHECSSNLSPSQCRTLSKLKDATGSWCLCLILYFPSAMARIEILSKIFLCVFSLRRKSFCVFNNAVACRDISGVMLWQGLPRAARGMRRASNWAGKSIQGVKELSKSSVHGAEWQEGCASRPGLMSGSAKMCVKILISPVKCIHELVQLY